MFKLFKNKSNIVIQLNKINHQNIQYFSSNNKLAEKLSFLDSEQQMRDYFNIVDWDKKEIQDRIYTRTAKEKDEICRKQRDYNTFHRKELYELYSKSRQDLLKPNEENKPAIGHPKNFLENKPDNYILIFGVSNIPVEEVVLLCKSIGQVVTHNAVYDLNGRLALVEVLFNSDEEAKTARFKLDKFEYQIGNILSVKYNLDAAKEGFGERTLVLENLPRNFSKHQILKEFGKHVNVLDIDIPVAEEIVLKDLNFDTIYQLNYRNFYKNLENNINNKKGKYTFMLAKVNLLLNEFKVKLFENNKIDFKKSLNLYNNLLVSIKFYMEKFIPTDVLNSLIRNELNTINKLSSPNVDLENAHKKITKAYECIVNNLENLINKYETKIKQQETPFTKEEVLINSADNDTEALPKDLIFNEKKDEIKIKLKLSEINFYGTFYPLQEQIDKLRFIRSLTDSEKGLLKDKYDIDLRLNFPSFLDYFQKYSQAIGVDLIDKYIELSNLYLSMHPAERLYHGRALAKKKGNDEDREIADFLLESLGIRTQKTFTLPNKITDLTKTVDREKSSQKDYYARYLISNLIEKLPNLTVQQVNKLISKEGNLRSKISYMRFIRTDNLTKKKEHVLQIRSKMKQFNESLDEIENYYKILTGVDPNAKAELETVIKELKNYRFGKNVEEINFDDIEQKPEKKNKSKTQKLAQLDITQLKNRIDILRIERKKLLNSIMNLIDARVLKNKRFEIVENKVKAKLRNLVSKVLSGNDELQAHYVNKIENELNSFKHSDSKANIKKFTLVELAEHIIQKEIDYNAQVGRVQAYIDTVEESLGEKINKNNIIQAFSTFHVVDQLNKNMKLSGDRKTVGSPIMNYFENVKDIFSQELKKLETLREEKVRGMNEYNIDETFNRKKELIEIYANRIAEYEAVKEEVNNELNEYRLTNLESFIDSEFRKKDVEANENAKAFGSANEQEYKDVTYLINNLKKLKGLDGLQKVNNIISNRKTNRGYAFVTFPTSAEAKIVYLLGYANMVMPGVKISPKFERTHHHFEIEKTLQIAKKDAAIIQKRKQLIEAEGKLNAFEKEWSAKLDNKHKEYNEILNAYKDLYTDPFKKHDKNNPFEEEDEEEIKRNLIKQEKETGIDNTWLFEDDKIEELRKFREQRLTKTYLDYELLKKGIRPEKVLKKTNYLQPIVDDFFSENTEMRLISESEKGSGRMKEMLTGKKFIEKYMGKDLSSSHNAAFPLERRETQIIREIKELRERFPKEKFVSSPEESQKLIDEINTTYLRLLEDDSEKKESGATNLELFDRISNLSPMNKQIKQVLKQRTEFLENEERRQLVTLENFYQNVSNSLVKQESTLENYPETLVNHEKKREEFYKLNPNLLNLRLFTGQEQYEKEEIYTRQLYVERAEDEEARNDDFVEKIKYKEQEVSEISTDSSSFRAFLNKRQSNRDKDKPKTKDKTQFDPKNISIEQIIGMKNEEKSVREKYRKHMTVDKKTEEVKNSLDLEKRKDEFLKAVESNFKDELETLPSFRDYFNGIKKTVEPNEYKYNFNEETDSYAKLREQLALLYSGKVNPETFEEVFIKDQKNYEEKLNNWFGEKDMDEVNDILNSKIGNLSPEDMMNRLREDIPDFDELIEQPEKMFDYFKNKQSESEWLDKINKFEDGYVDEYYFNPECGQTIQEHLADLSKSKFKHISIRTDKDGRIIIKREYKNNYKYDLDEILNFDVVEERNKMMKKLESFNFEEDINSKANYYAQLTEYIKANKLEHLFENSNHEDTFRRAEDFISRKYEIEGFNLIDLAAMTENLFKMNSASLSEFLKNMQKLNDFGNISNNSNLVKEIKSIREFSNNIFSEREVRLLFSLLTSLKTDLSKINLDGIKKFIFIQDVLLAELLSNLKSVLKENIIYIYAILKFLPEAVDVKKDHINIIRNNQWEKYKNYMTKKLTIAIKKEEKINPNILTEEITEVSNLLTAKKLDSKKIDDEIRKFAVHLKNYYIELSKASKFFLI
jgi:hypothetical protein